MGFDYSGWISSVQCIRIFIGAMEQWRQMPSKKLTARGVLTKLRKLYDPPKTFLSYRTPLDLTVATILSAQCTDNRVNYVAKHILYPKYKTPEDYVNVPRAQLEKDIHSCGTYHNKAKYIQTMCALLIKHHDGNVPDTMEELIKLPGIGRKTAAIITYAAYGKPQGIAVDTHVMRLARRLGLSRHHNPDKISLDLMEQIPKKDWGNLTTLLISHGRAICTARKRACERCIFKKTCPSSSVLGKKDLAK